MKKLFFSICLIAGTTTTISLSSCKKTDVTAPELVITGGDEQYQSLPATANTATFNYPTATATDDMDGDISSQVTYSGNVNPNVKGVYPVRYSVSDAQGNITALTVNIHIVNDAEWIAGNYSVVDSVYNTSPVLPGLPFVTSYSGNPNENISTDSYINNKIWATKFGNYTGGLVYLTLSGTGNGATIDIPTQNVLCGNPSALRTFSDDSQIPAATVFVNGTRPGFLLYYKEVVTANSTTAHSTGRYYHD